MLCLHCSVLILSQLSSPSQPFMASFPKQNKKTTINSSLPNFYASLTCSTSTRTTTTINQLTSLTPCSLPLRVHIPILSASLPNISLNCFHLVELYALTRNLLILFHAKNLLSSLGSVQVYSNNTTNAQHSESRYKHKPKKINTSKATMRAIQQQREL